MTDTEVPPERIAELADKAADELEQRGWTRNVLVRPDTGTVCASGAACAALEMIIYVDNYGWSSKGNWADHETEGTEHLALMQALDQQVDGADDIPHWNDEIVKSADEVIQAFRDVATKHRSDAMTTGGQA